MRKQVPRYPSVRHFLHDRRGEMMVDILVKFMMAVALIASLMEFYGVFTKYQNVSFTAQRLTRAIEVSGTVNGIGADFAGLCSTAGLTGASYIINAPYCDASGSIQLRDSFSVTVRYTYYFRIFSPSFAPPVQVPIPMSVTLHGMSEVYHKL